MITNEDEIEALAAEIAEREGLGYEQARDAAAVELASLRQYAQEWNAERTQIWRGLQAFARAWDWICEHGRQIQAARWN